ncbi:MAG TPA: arginine deiminase family protein, partial [Myxococcales bacterium]|nr:arginine deiminase family protein [Myxococcales bacterium]
MSRAVLRRPGPDFAEGITTASLGAPDYSLLLAQHAAYADALRSLGLAVEVLDALPGFPDAYFVEDVAVVVPDLAVIARPGAPSRLGEEEGIDEVLAWHREIARIEAPGTLDGGDVLVADRHVFVGLSARTNREGAEQLARRLAPHGYRVTTVPVSSGLHLKSGVSWLGARTMLVTKEVARHFHEYRCIVAEEAACNTVLVNDTLLVPSGSAGAVA